MAFDELSHSIGLLIRDEMYAVLDDFDLNVCAPMRPQRIGEAWHELLERRVFARSEYQCHADGALLRRIEFLIRRKGPIDLQRRPQMFRSGICPGVARHPHRRKCRNRENGENKWLRDRQGVAPAGPASAEIDMPSDAIAFNHIPRP